MSTTPFTCTFIIKYEPNKGLPKEPDAGRFSCTLIKPEVIVMKKLTKKEIKYQEQAKKLLDEAFKPKDVREFLDGLFAEANISYTATLMERDKQIL